MVHCNADLDYPCDADDGEPCPSCKATEAYWRAEYDRTPAAVRRLDTRDGLEEARQECADAGRGGPWWI